MSSSMKVKTAEPSPEGRRDDGIICGAVAQSIGILSARLLSSVPSSCGTHTIGLPPELGFEIRYLHNLGIETDFYLSASLGLREDLTASDGLRHHRHSADCLRDPLPAVRRARHQRGAASVASGN